MVYVIQVCWQLASRIRTELASCQQTCMTYTTAVCTVKNSWWRTEELPETCKVEFQKQFWEISASSCYILRIYHDALSPERQTRLQAKYIHRTSNIGVTNIRLHGILPSMCTQFVWNEVLAVVMKVTGFVDVMPCSTADICRRFGVVCCLL